MINCWNPSNIHTISDCMCIICIFLSFKSVLVPECDFLLLLRKHAVGSAIYCSVWESAVLICRCFPVTWPAYFAPFLFSVSCCSAIFLRSVGRCWAGCGWVCSRRRAVRTVHRLDSWCDYKYVCCAFTCAERQDPPLFPPPCALFCVFTPRDWFFTKTSAAQKSWDSEWTFFS